ncbi:MAG: potassium channel family protein [Planctomycetota bacterium]
MSTVARRLLLGCGILALTILIGTLGYVLAGWTWVDAIYMVTITVFGVGYGEVHPMTDPGLKLFTILIIVTGCSSGIYVVGGFLQMITEGQVKRIMGIHQSDRELKNLRDHAIICGYGRVGNMLSAQLQQAGQSLVIVDRDPERVQQATNEGLLAIVGDATHDSTLMKVGIYSARSLATVLPNDAMNVFITLTTRDLCENIQIIARAECPSTERKLLRSGASQVVMPAAIGATRIAELVTRDHVEHHDERDANIEAKLLRQLSGLGVAEADTATVS